MKEILEWEDQLCELSEKYCKHDDRDYNSCLYYIFKPFIKSLLSKERQSIVEELDGMKLSGGLLAETENRVLDTAIQIIKRREG